MALALDILIVLGAAAAAALVFAVIHHRSSAPLLTRTAAFFPAGERYQFDGDLVCYGRAVINQEWPAMQRGHSNPLVDYWVGTYRALFGRLQLRSPREQFAFQELLSLAATRTAGRLQRLNDDTPAVPTELWLALILGGLVAVALHLGMTDPRERLSVHAPMVAGVAAVVATGLLLVNFLDHPYEPYVGGIQPTAMRQTLTMVQNVEPGLQPPCNLGGRPR